MDPRLLRLGFAVGVLLTLFGLSQAFSAPWRAGEAASRGKGAVAVLLCADESSGAVRLPQGGEGCEKGEHGFLLGQRGARGKRGRRGAQGVAGPTGPHGPQGPRGAQGPQGAQGPPFTTAFGYFYSQQDSSVLPNGDIPLDTTGAADGLALLGPTGIVVQQAGTYEIGYTLTGDGATDIDAGLFVNGLLVAGSSGSSSGRQLGVTVIAQLEMNDLVSVGNVGTANLGLDSSVGSDTNVSASVALSRIGN
jgi:hypothetical protein